METLDKIPEYSVVEIVGSHSVYIDRDVLEIFQDFKAKAKRKHIQLTLRYSRGRNHRVALIPKYFLQGSVNKANEYICAHDKICFLHFTFRPLLSLIFWG